MKLIIGGYERVLWLRVVPEGAMMIAAHCHVKITSVQPSVKLVYAKLASEALWLHSGISACGCQAVRIVPCQPDSEAEHWAPFDAQITIN